ncbi:MAG: hypothetical protein HYU30_09520 [Chloroflexi bacterium]|nr:hypothetical protein [Chloroflexota bacterium]
MDKTLHEDYRWRMFGKKVVFYGVASTVIALAAQALGANIGVVFFAGLIGPPLILLGIAIVRYNRR